MKIGVAYNIWDGDEHLPESLFWVKQFADYIVGVYSNQSNSGEQYAPTIPEGFDKLIEYIPNDGITRHQNELAKRNLGYEACINEGCTLFMTIDCDEIYDPYQLMQVAIRMNRDGYDASACQMQTYYGDTFHQYAEPETYYVPLLYKVNASLRFREYVQFPVLADPTRKLPSKKVLVLNRDECEMHHYSYVRKDIARKLRNSSAYPNIMKTIEKSIEYYRAWKDPMPGYVMGNLIPLKKVDNQFTTQAVSKANIL
jgi:hypothetical protein